MSVIPRSLSVASWLRGEQQARRGQTLILALAILFLLTILGSIFVTTLLRNLSRVTRQSKTDESLTLAMAGIQFAANQFRTSVEGADWRPTPSEPLWRVPNVAAPPPQRQLDPDVDWLSDNGTYQRPYVRFGTGRGRFLLRVTYLPNWEAQSATSTGLDQFQANSEMIHIESIGRSGEFDPNDPSFLRDPTATRGTGDSTSFRKVEAFVPIGLIDQLWWITNHTNEPGPAKWGVPTVQNHGYDPRYASNPAVTPQFNQQLMEYPAMFQGSIRSNTDLEFYGRNVIRFYPARGEGLFVKGEIRLAPRGALPNPGSIQLQIDAMDDDGNNRAPTLVGTTPVLDGDANLDDDPANDSRLASVAQSESSAATFDPVTILTQARNFLWGVLDDQHRRQDPTTGPGSPKMRSIRHISAPLLNQEDFAKGINRWRELTRDSGAVVQLASGRYVNTGAYGMTDRVTAVRTDDPAATPVPALPATERAKGLYIDNFDDVQYPKNRPRVKDEWLQRLASPSWAGDRYTPTIDKTVDHPDRKTPSPVVDLLLTAEADASGTLRPVIKETRFDPDVRQVNEPQGNSSDPRLAYNLINTAGTWNLVPVGQSRTYDYPENGVVFAEGSIRVRGVSGVPGIAPEPLTIVSGGTIYIEGNLLQLRDTTPEASASGWQVSLLAQDNVVLNPTAFTRITNPNGSVLPPAGDPDDPTVDGFYRIQPGSELDFASTTADTLPGSRWLLHMKHAGGDRTDPTAETRVTLNLPSLPGASWPLPTDQYDFGGNVPPPPTPAYSGLNQLFYLFHEISPGTSPIGWGESSWRYPDREQKTFFIPGLGGRSRAGLDNTFRIQNNLTTVANDKDYLLGKVAVLPETGPLPIRIEAVMYAFTGSWFVIPPPFFNDHLDAAKQGDPYDTRAFFAANSLVREDPSTYPINTDHYPFYREPLNVDIQVVGAITENMPAEPAERALWTSHLWLSDPNYDPSAFPAASPPPFRPNLRYQYDGDLRRMVRVRNTRTGQEVVAWAAPVTGRKPAAMATVQAVVNQWLATEDAYAVTLPLTPRLPAGAVFYEGNPL
ncbi:MAG: hypothetical protein ACO1SX_19985 [Actinomycetota bacterium]